jgi:CheY-like chemotaxis protein
VGPGSFDCGKDEGAPLRLSGKRILIVEDEALVALDLELAFEDEGAEIVGPALSLGHALDLLEGEQAIAGAVLDVDLGGLDVFPVAEILRERGVPFIFHTGHATRESLELLFPGSVTCTKPTQPSTLITELLRLRH